MFTTLAANACSLCLESGRPVKTSVEVLEQGRGAILGLMIDDRRDISHLCQLYPEDAIDYERLRSEVNAIPSENLTAATESHEDVWKQRARAIQELEEECIDRLRHLPGLERFLLGASASEIQQQASAEPIVMVNATVIRSDAIIIRLDQIQSMSLPLFSVQVLRSWKRKNLTDFTTKTFGKQNKKFCEFLSWVWESCVQTVVDSLVASSRTSKPAMPTLRVWWVGTEEANNVPFHAAGTHTLGSSDNTVSNVVSSYTPTIKALQFAREMLERCKLHSKRNSGKSSI